VNGGWPRRLAFAAAGSAILLLSWWVRDPSIPYGAVTPGASANSPDSALDSEAESRRARAVAALSAKISAEHRALGALAASALDAPQEAEAAFDFLKSRGAGEETGVIIADAAGPQAWAGQFRNTPVLTGTGTSLLVSPFYVTLQVAIVRGTRIALASSLLHAEPPADRIADGIDDRIAERKLVSAFRFAPLSDPTADAVMRGGNGRPLLRVEAIPMPSGMIRFAETAASRGRGALLLAAALAILIAFGWSDRRALGLRLFTLVVAVAAIALVPWNNFSNFARIFDPAYFYSPFGGPFTASAGAFAMFSTVLLFAVIALIRARRAQLPRIPAGIVGAVLVAAGIVALERIARGIVLPPWGATASLWITWEVPLFVFLFSIFLAAVWLIRIALARRPMVELGTAAVIALVCGVAATFVVWTKTTEQRLQLAMRDVAGLERADSDAVQLLTRFGSQLVSYDSAGTRADLLERYAASDLAAAGLQVSLGISTPAGERKIRLDLAQLTYDSAELASVVSEAASRQEPVVRQMLGPTGRQSILAVPHRGGVTTVVASPHTRLVALNPYTALLGFDQPDKTEPPYNLTLADVTPGGGAKTGTMRWRRVANEWHGDQIIDTSHGPSRAHVEVDLRSWPTRLVRVALIVILDVAIAGMLWALGTMSEGGFFRWMRGRSSLWIGSYRGRLTLALFAFFVIPAVGFGFWSYQRLQRDDRGVRELLIREILSAAGTGAPAAEIAREGVVGAPLFVFSNGILSSSSDSLYEMLAPAGRMIPRRVHVNIALHGELSATSRENVAGSTMFWGYRAVSASEPENVVVAAPARSDELVLDRRRRDLTLLVLFATAVGAIAAFWLSGFAARILARDLELARLEVRRAERVIAWGEMARQVAHEIKNPLTPIRLGVQHLRRARTDPRVDFDRVLDDNVTRILSEIDRLDKIAQTFTRYGTAPEELPPAEDIDVAAILRDVVALEKMGIGGVDWMLQGAENQVFARARKDELRDVLLNVFENARLARARRVRVSLVRMDRAARIEIGDDGSGIPRDALPRVFEPHFSTRTTGSGLGLAISRRLIESWGGSIDLESEEGKGARVSITLQSLAT
jgi:signal transduction histidine kinase